MKSIVKVLQSQKGSISGIVSGIVGIVVIGLLAANLWGTLQSSGTDIAALTETDAATVTLQGAWPIVLLVAGVGIALGAVIYALKRFGIMG